MATGKRLKLISGEYLYPIEFYEENGNYYAYNDNPYSIYSSSSVLTKVDASLKIKAEFSSIEIIETYRDRDYRIVLKTPNTNPPYSTGYQISTSKLGTEFVIFHAVIGGTDRYFEATVASDPNRDEDMAKFLGVINHDQIYTNHPFTGRLTTWPGSGGRFQYYFSAVHEFTSLIYNSNCASDYEIHSHPENENDPYGGGSTGGGGGGSFDGSSDAINFPGLPTIQLTDAKFFNLYNPSIFQIQQLANYMWSDTPNWDTFKKVLANPMDAIIGLMCVPVNVPNGGEKEVQIGNIGTGINMTLAASQWVTHSCGSVTIPEYYGSYLDYSPYTSIQLYLPYIGVQSVSANDLISHAGKTLSIQYNVDIVSGACVACLKCGNSVLYSWQGSCGLQIPFTSLTYGNLVNGLLQIGSGVLMASANPVAGVGSLVTGAISANTQDISHGGGISGAGGFLGIQVPYFIITRPNMCLPDDQNKYIGYPSYITVPLGEISGFTRVEDIHLENIPATSAEIEEIESLLKSGVYM